MCDKGGECPLQDITFGWGPGISRFVEPKRHFVKPLELSPTIAIDRERCILCYRCVRFSQEISEDNQLVLLERGAHSYVSTFDGHPYVAPFAGNIVELCPVGALTSRPYRFRARPWDIEDAGSVCTLCPSQCNVTLTVRDERVLRVQAREHHEVDDGWLCDRGRFAYPALGGAGTGMGAGRARRSGGRDRRRARHGERITEPLLRDGGELRPVSWERALEEAAAGLRRAGARTGALVGGEATNEEGYLLARLHARGPWLPASTRAARARCRSSCTARLNDPRLQARVSDLEFAHAVLVLDGRPDRGRADPRPAPAQGHPPPRHAGCIGPSAADLLSGERARRQSWSRGCAGAGEEIVILWHERLTGRPRRRGARPRAARARGRAVPGRYRRRGPAGNPRRRERPRPARGGRAAERRPRAERALAGATARDASTRSASREPGRGRAGGGAAAAIRPAGDRPSSAAIARAVGPGAGASLDASSRTLTF